MVSTTPTMFPLVNWQKITPLLVTLVDLLQCRRRKDAKISPPLQKRAASQGSRKKHTSANLDDSDDTQKSTDISSSTREPSTDGSDLDSPTSMKGGSKAPPGFGISPPPGLEAPPGLENLNRAKGARLNSQAKAFVPSAAGNSTTQRVRESIHRLKESLEEWEADPPVSRYPKNQLSESVDEQPLSALKEAISKLSPQDAAVVRSFLLAKEGEQRTAPMQLNRNVMNAHALRNEDSQRARVYSNPSWRNAIGAQREPWESCSRKTTARQKPPVQIAENADTLKTYLRDLAALDTDRVVMVRRINRLGLDSAPALEAYFSKFGTIDRLMVSHSNCKSTSGAIRVRPATVGFVVMSTVEEAQAVKALGEEHVVQGATVLVASFQSHPVEE